MLKLGSPTRAAPGLAGSVPQYQALTRGPSRPAPSPADLRQPRDVFEGIRRSFGRTHLGAFAACAELSRGDHPISGERMARAVLAGGLDGDGRSTSSEVREFERFAARHAARLTPEAREVLTTWKREVDRSGQGGLLGGTFQKLTSRLLTLHDVGAWRALERLDETPGRVSGEAMSRAVLTAVRDDGRSGPRQTLEQFEAWAQKNDARLTPQARRVLDVLRSVATATRDRGRELSSSEFARMAQALRSLR
ncbi:MAG: hypothetical protein IPJ65_12255 [Archangiaceae bacterium]|nr:hypothetical protein [Archangiaceae bacterium]